MPPDSNVKLYCTPIRPRVGEREGLTQRVEYDSNGNVDPTLLCDFCAQCKPILHRLVIKHNAADWQTLQYAAYAML